MTQLLTSDEALATRAANGDRPAFAELYERHSTALYDFCARLMRDPDTAADVVQAAFIKAWEGLPRWKRAVSFRAWLFTIARNTAIDEFRKARHTVPLREDEGAGEMSAPSVAYALVDPDRLSNPEEALRDRELAGLVWEAAAGLSERDYALLDLHLRQGFDADELAAALGASKGSVYTMLTRLRQALAESVGAAVMMRQGRDCPELRAITGDAPAHELTRELRAAIARHVEECPRCGDRRRKVLAPAEIFAALAPLPLAPGLQDAMWSGISIRLEARAPAPAGSLPGRLAASLARHPLAWVVGFVAAIAILAGGIATAASLRGEAEPRDPADVRSSSHGVGIASSRNVVELQWTPPRGARGYSYHWDHEPASLPDAVAELPGEATGVTSPSLAPGEWHFHMRTKGPGGRWTSTVHLGPFLLTGSGETPRPEATPTTTATPTPSPSPAPSPATSPTPSPSPAAAEGRTGESPPPPPPPPSPPPPPPSPSVPPPPPSPSPSAVLSPSPSPSPPPPSPTKPPPPPPPPTSPPPTMHH